MTNTGSSTVPAPSSAPQSSSRPTSSARSGFRLAKNVVVRGLALLVLGMMLCRVTFVGINGTGTGKSRAALSPLESSLYFGVRELRLRGGATDLGKTAQSGAGLLLTPGEAYRIVAHSKPFQATWSNAKKGKFNATDLQSTFDVLSREVRLAPHVADVRAKELEKDSNYAKFFRDQPILAPLISLTALTTGLLIFFLPREASLLFFLSNMSFFILAQNVFGGRTAIESTGFVMLAAAAVVSMLSSA